MCALLLGNPWGELRGKLGGNIFARNIHGAYVRQYVKPVNPNTTAQGIAKDAFANVVSQYRNLSSEERTAWNEYAKTVYIPRQGSTSGRYSGYQAFVAVKIANERSQFLNRTYTLFNETNSTITDFEVEEWNSSSYPAPNKGKLNNLLLSNGSSSDFTLDAVGVSKIASITFTITSGNPAVTKLFRDMKDSNNRWNGFVLYMSNPVYGENMFIQNELYMCLGFFKPWKFNPSGSSFLSFGKIRYRATDNFNLAKYKKFPPIGRWVRLTLFSIDTEGQLKRVGSKFTQIANSI